MPFHTENKVCFDHLRPGHWLRTVQAPVVLPLAPLPGALAGLGGWAKNHIFLRK